MMPLLPKNNNKGLVFPYITLPLSFSFQKKWLDPLIKVAIFGLLLGGITYQLTLNQNLGEIGQFLKNQATISVCGGLLIVGLLMIANWLTETLKWHQLLRPVDTLSFKDALKGVLLGVTVSLFTPNRIGEYGGRIWVIKKGMRTQAVVATVIGSIAQWIINIGVGGIVATGLLLSYSGIAKWSIWVVMIAMLPFLTLLIALYVNLHWIERVCQRFSFLKKYSKYVYFLRNYSKPQLLRIIVFSMLRYSLYCLQFILLILIFGIKIDFVTSVAVVNTLFFLQTLVPSIALMELGIRGNLALYLFGFFTTNTVAVLASTFALWGINLLVPALMGYYLLLRTRITKT